MTISKDYLKKFNQYIVKPDKRTVKQSLEILIDDEIARREKN
jgi:hypothetical protein